MWSLSLPTPRPSRISTVIARQTTSREARSLARRRVALHEALAGGIDEIAAFAARAFGDEAAGAVDAGRVELHELHVLQRDRRRAAPSPLPSPVQVWALSRGEVGAAVAAGGENGRLAAEAVDRAVVHLQADEPAHAAFVVADEVDGEILDEELALRLQRLAVERVQHGVAGAVGGGAGALRRCPCRIRSSCRRTGAGRSCLPRCARTARPSGRARRPRRARCGRGIRSRPGRRASRSP